MREIDLECCDLQSLWPGALFFTFDKYLLMIIFCTFLHPSDSTIIRFNLNV